MAQLIFKRGSLANLNNLAIKDGQFIVTTDEGALYVDNGSTRVRLGDFIVVENVAALPESANRKAMYYCEAENVLARWNGTEWKQINKQPTTAELKVALGLDAEGVVTAAIAAAKKAGDDAQADVDSLATYVGTIPNGEDGQPMAASVVAYINKKTDGIATSGNLEALGNRVTTVEGKVATIEGDYLKKADKTELEGKISAAQTAADNAQSHSDGVASDLADHEKDAVAHITAAEREAWNGKTTMAEVEAKNYLVAADIAGKANAADVYDKDEIDAKVETINGAIDLKANAADVYTKGEIDTKVKALEDEDDRLEGLINGKVAQTAYETKVGELVAEDERLAGLIADNATAISDEATARGNAISGLKTELEGKIALKADQTALDAEVEAREGAIDGLQTQINTIMNNPDAEGAINSINEFTQYVTEHGTIADGFRTDIDKNKEDIAAMDKAYKAADTVINGRLDVLEAIDHDAYVAADSALKSELEGKINAKADTTALNSAVQALEAADTGLGNRITALETNSATKTELQGVADDLSAYETAHAGDYTNAQIDAAIDADVKVVADDLKAYKEAHASDYTNEQINSAIANAGHAAASDLADHIADTVSHVTADDKAKWNGAEQNAKDYADAQVAAAKEDASNKDAVVLAEAQKAVDAAKTELQTALDTYKTSNDAAVAGKADKATTLAGYGITDAYTKTEVEAMLTWGEF